MEIDFERDKKIIQEANEWSFAQLLINGKITSKEIKEHLKTAISNYGLEEE